MLTGCGHQDTRTRFCSEFGQNMQMDGFRAGSLLTLRPWPVPACWELSVGAQTVKRLGSCVWLGDRVCRHQPADTCLPHSLPPAPDIPPPSPGSLNVVPGACPMLKEDSRLVTKIRSWRLPSSACVDYLTPSLPQIPTLSLRLAFSSLNFVCRTDFLVEKSPSHCVQCHLFASSRVRRQGAAVRGSRTPPLTNEQ